MIEPRIKVANPDDPEPNINLYVEDQTNPAMQLVTEMMILCGEAVAAFGADNNIPLPYRGHPQSSTAVSAFAYLPEGPARSVANISVLRAAEMDFRKPVAHGVLGVPGYVQFSSPIRRYVDLLAHYQVYIFEKMQRLAFLFIEQLSGIYASIKHTNYLNRCMIQFAGTVVVN
jgi:exoribonuclease R